MSFKKIGFKPETQSPVEVASAHAGRPLVKGIEPWLRERDIYYIDPWPLLESIRPDLKGRFYSLEELHNHYAGNIRYLEVKNDSPPGATQRPLFVIGRSQRAKAIAPILLAPPLAIAPKEQGGV